MAEFGRVLTGFGINYSHINPERTPYLLICETVESGTPVRAATAITEHMPTYARAIRLCSNAKYAVSHVWKARTCMDFT